MTAAPTRSGEPGGDPVRVLELRAGLPTLMDGRGTGERRVARTGRAAAAPSRLEERARSASDELAAARGDLDRTRVALERSQVEAERARVSYRRLAGHPAVRLLRAVRQLPRRVSARLRG